MSKMSRKRAFIENLKFNPTPKLFNLFPPPPPHPTKMDWQDIRHSHKKMSLKFINIFLKKKLESYIFSQNL